MYNEGVGSTQVYSYFLCKKIEQSHYIFIPGCDIYKIEVVPSELQIWADIPAFKGEFLLETETGSIEGFSHKFRFKIVSERVYPNNILTAYES
jgi:hypothetical protein